METKKVSFIYHNRVKPYLNFHNTFIYQNIKVANKKRKHKKFITLSWQIAPSLYHHVHWQPYTLTTMVPKRRPRIWRSIASYSVLPTGRKGTAGKTANTQKIAKAIEPRTTFTEEAKAIFAAQQEKILLLYYSKGSMLMKFPSCPKL